MGLFDLVLSSSKYKTLYEKSKYLYAQMNTVVLTCGRRNNLDWVWASEDVAIVRNQVGSGWMMSRDQM